MRISQLSDYFRNLNLKSETVLKDKIYYINCNRQIKDYIKKLLSLNLVEHLKVSKNKWALAPGVLLQFKVLVNPLSFNLKNKSLILKEYLKEDPYSELIISTSKGLKTFNECCEEKIGGVIKVLIKCKTRR